MYANELKVIIAKGLAELEAINKLNARYGRPLETYFVARIPISEIVIDNEKEDDYQRPLNKQRVNAIVANFNYDLTDVKTFNYRNGKLHSSDGQHLADSMKKKNCAYMWGKIFVGKTEKEEAHLFSSQDDNKARVNPVDKWFADVKAEEPYALHIKKALEEANLSVHRNGVGRPKRETRTISCIKDLIPFEEKYGLDGLRFIFRIIDDAGWGHFDDAFKRINLLIGINAYPICKEEPKKEESLLHMMIQAGTPKQFAKYYATEEYAQYSTAMHPEKSLAAYVKDILNN